MHPVVFHGLESPHVQKRPLHAAFMMVLSCQEDALTGFTLWAVLAVAGLSNFALSALAIVGSYLGVSLFSSCGARVHGVVGGAGRVSLPDHALSL